MKHLSTRVGDHFAGNLHVGWLVVLLVLVVLGMVRLWRCWWVVGGGR